jgi:hypothetical protein
MLWGLLAVALPPIIHLFRLQRRKPISFPDIRLLEALLRETRSTRTLTRWLLMALRMLAIACLFLALAQPQWNSNANQPGKDWLMVLDLGPRSALTNGSSTVGQELLRAASQMVGSAGTETRIRILSGGQAEPTPPLSRAEALSHLGQLETSTQGLSERAVINASRNPAVTRIRLGTPDASMPSDTLPWYGWMVQPEAAYNTTFDSVWTDPPAPPPGSAFSLNLQLSFSGAPQGTATLQLFANQQLEGTMPVQVGSLPVQVGFPMRANADTVAFKAVVSGDQLPIDDTLFFGLTWQQPATSVLKIGSPQLAQAMNRIFQSGDQPSLRLDGSLSAAAISFAESGGLVFVFPEGPVSAPGATQASTQEPLRWSAASVQRTLGKALTGSPNALSMPLSKPLFTNLPGWATRMTYENGLPLLLEKPMGTGTLYLFNAQVNGEWDLNPLTGVLTYALWLQQQSNTPWLIFAGDDTPLRLDLSIGESPIQLVQPHQTAIPAQQRVGGQTHISGSFFQAPTGLYRLVHQNQTLGWCGVNPSREAGKLNLLPLDDWQNIHPEYTLVTQPEAFAQTHSEGGGLEPATWLLLLALSVLVLESLWSQYRHT